MMVPNLRTAAGEYIAPERIEGTLTKTGLVQQIFVHGNPFESSVVAVVVPNQAELTCVPTSPCALSVQHCRLIAAGVPCKR